MSIINYKDYQGQVSFEGDHLLIELLHVDDTVMCECRDLGSVQSAFEELVDDYIETCRQIGKEPQKPFRGSFNVRVGPELHRKAAMAATCDRITLNAWVQAAMEEKISDLAHHRQSQRIAEDIARVMRATDMTNAWSRGTPEAELGIVSPKMITLKQFRVTGHRYGRAN